MKLQEILGKGESFRYMLLNRMAMDCDYYLGYGNRRAKYLWAQSEREQIDVMKAIWDSFPPEGKPGWLTFEGILDYEKKMIPEETP